MSNALVVELNDKVLQLRVAVLWLQDAVESLEPRVKRLEELQLGLDVAGGSDEADD